MFKDELLEQLVGTWELSGQMGKASLHHRVVVRWVLGHQFLQIHTQEWEPASAAAPYESLYYIGRNDAKQTYVFHLIDTFGGGFSETLGQGVRDGNSLVFVFVYSQGPFENVFTWNKGDQTWDMILRFKTGSGDWQTFATKKLTRTVG